MSSELPYSPPKKQLINFTFSNRAAATTGQPPDTNPSVVAETSSSEANLVLDCEKYYEIRVSFGSNTYWIYQNVQTGGFIFVENNKPGTIVIESTTATLWVKIKVTIGGFCYFKLSPARACFLTTTSTTTAATSDDEVFIKLKNDDIEQPLVLGQGDEGTQWNIQEAGP